MNRINEHTSNPEMMLWQVIIHMTFVLSAIAPAWIDRLTFKPANAEH